MTPPDVGVDLVKRACRSPSSPTRLEDRRYSSWSSRRGRPIRRPRNHALCTSRVRHRRHDDQVGRGRRQVDRSVHHQYSSSVCPSGKKRRSGGRATAGRAEDDRGGRPLGGAELQETQRTSARARPGSRSARGLDVSAASRRPGPAQRMESAYSLRIAIMRASRARRAHWWPAASASLMSGSRTGCRSGLDLSRQWFINQSVRGSRRSYDERAPPRSEAPLLEFKASVADGDPSQRARQDRASVTRADRGYKATMEGNGAQRPPIGQSTSWPARALTTRSAGWRAARTPQPARPTARRDQDVVRRPGAASTGHGGARRPSPPPRPVDVRGHGQVAGVSPTPRSRGGRPRGQVPADRGALGQPVRHQVVDVRRRASGASGTVPARREHPLSAAAASPAVPGQPAIHPRATRRAASRPPRARRARRVPLRRPGQGRTARPEGPRSHHVSGAGACLPHGAGETSRCGRRPATARELGDEAVRPSPPPHQLRPVRPESSTSVTPARAAPEGWAVQRSSWSTAVKKLPTADLVPSRSV